MSAAAGQAGVSRPTLVPLHVLPAPRHRPPVLPEPEPLPWEPGAPRSSPFIQDALAVDFSLMSDEQLFGAQPTRRSELPDPRVWAGHIAQGLVEVMAGARPAPQLLRWTTPEVYAVVPRRASVSTRRGVPATRRGPAANRRATVRSVRVCEPADGVAEVGAVVAVSRRARAIALRLEGRDGRWRVTALQTA